MTGFVVRIHRDGIYQNIDFDELTDAELGDFISSRPVSEGWNWAKALAKWIRDHVRYELEMRIPNHEQPPRGETRCPPVRPDAIE